MQSKLQFQVSSNWSTLSCWIPIHAEHMAITKKGTNGATPSVQKKLPNLLISTTFDDAKVQRVSKKDRSRCKI